MPPQHPGSAPATPRPAATVLVLRNGADGVEVLLVRRSASAKFAADAWVFPGGVVDDADRTLPEALWTGLQPPALTPRFNAEADLVLGFHVAAVRETFEEAGLLLAVSADGEPVDPNDPAVQAERAELNERGRDSAGQFAAWVADRGVVLDLSTLTYLSRWVTPTFESRRYDTCFFLATVPAGQIAEHDHGETTDQRWVSAADALAASKAGEMVLMPPTIYTLRDVATATSVADLVGRAAAQPAVRSLQPHVEVDEDGKPVRLLHPDDPDYPAHLYA